MLNNLNATKAGTFNDRFQVIYSNSALGIANPVADTNSVVVYNTENLLNVNAGNIQITDITVYDLRGRIIYTKNNINSTATILEELQPQQQGLIVKVITPEGTLNNKRYLLVMPL